MSNCAAIRPSPSADPVIKMRDMGPLVRLVRARAICVPLRYVAGWLGRSSKTISCASHTREGIGQRLPGRRGLPASSA
jgi:hypothetical protein